LVPQFQGKSKNPTKIKQNRNDTQISRPDLRFASRKNSKTTQKGLEPQPKTPTPKTTGFTWDTLAKFCVKLYTTAATQSRLRFNLPEG